MPERTPVVIFGAGGFAREVLELVNDINADERRYEVLGFLDDRESMWGTSLNDVPILGGIPWLTEQPRPVAVLLGIGSPATKHRVVSRLRGVAGSFPSLVHPSVVMSKRVEQGIGTIICAGNIWTTNIRLGDFTTTNLACTVGHDVQLGSWSTIAPGVNVSGNVTIGEGCDVGTGSAIIQGVTIGEWSVVGAGAVVARDVPSNCTAVGVPAKPIKHRDPGWQLA